MDDAFSKPFKNNGFLKAMENAAKFSSANISFPEFNAIELPKLRNYMHADYQYEVIRETIIDFEKSLDSEHEVAVKLASFGQTIILNITDLGYSNPSLIHFFGYLDNGCKAELIQHINQINFLLLAVLKAEPQQPPRRIGFDLKPAELDDSGPEE